MIRRQWLLVLAGVALLAGNAEAADLKYRIRQRICQMNDTCPETGSSGSSGGSSGGGDTTPPQVAGFSPADEAGDVWGTANLVMTFGEDIQAGAGDIVIHRADNSVFETLAANGSGVSISGGVVTINPVSGFEDGTGYYVTVGADAFMDMAGNAFAGISDDATWNFTVSAVWPVAIQTLPESRSWTAFSSGGNTYALLGRHNHTGPNNWALYKFDPASERFSETQVVPISGMTMAYWTLFSHGGAVYALLSADGLSALDDHFYKFNEATEQFDHLQTIGTASKNVGWAVHEIDGIIYAHTNDYCSAPSCGAHLNTTELHEFDPSLNGGQGGLALRQTLTTASGPYASVFFEGNGKVYLMIACYSSYADTLHVFDGASRTLGSAIQTVSMAPENDAGLVSAEINSNIYVVATAGTSGVFRYDPALVGGQGGLESLQSLPGTGASGAFFWPGAQAYFINGSGLYAFDASLNGGKGGFTRVEDFAGSTMAGALDVEPFEEGGKRYMLSSGTTSYLYRSF